MKKTTVITSLIVLITICWVSVLLAACRKEGIVSAPGGSTTTAVHEMKAVPYDDSALQQEIAALKARNEALSNEKGILENEKAARDNANSALQSRISQLEEQNKALQDENGALGEKVVFLNQTIADNGAAHQAETGMLNERIQGLNQTMAENDAAYQAEIDRLNKALEEKEAAYQTAQKQLDDQSKAATVASSDGTSSGAENTASDGKTKSKASAGRIDSQVRNVVGFKIGPDLVDIEATLAVMPHWFLIANAGMVETPEDFVEDKFPGHSSNHNIFSGKYNFLYDVMGGMGFNWQFNSLPAQPNVYLSTMLGPAWFMYEEDGDLTSKLYLLWRTSVGFDLTIYKNLLFTTDIGFDWMKDYDFTPRLSVGLLYRYSPKWSIFGKKN